MLVSYRMLTSSGLKAVVGRMGPTKFMIRLSFSHRVLPLTEKVIRDAIHKGYTCTNKLAKELCRLQITEAITSRQRAVGHGACYVHTIYQ